MAQQGPFSDDSSKESARVDLYLQWVSLVTGGIPATFLRANGFGTSAPVVAPVVRTGVGLFTVQFEQPWAMKYLSFNALFQQTAYSAAGACECVILTDNLMATTGVMTVEITNAAGAAVDPTTGDVITLHFEMQAYTAGY